MFILPLTGVATHRAKCGFLFHPIIYPVIGLFLRLNVDLLPLGESHATFEQ
jgi:hypothetical protein